MNIFAIAVQIPIWKLLNLDSNEFNNQKLFFVFNLNSFMGYYDSNKVFRLTYEIVFLLFKCHPRILIANTGFFQIKKAYLWFIIPPLLFYKSFCRLFQLSYLDQLRIRQIRFCFEFKVKKFLIPLLMIFFLFFYPNTILNYIK